MSTTPTAPSPQPAPFPLLSLPPELRLQIYAYALLTPSTIICAYSPVPSSASQSPLTLTSHLLRSETLHLFYTLNDFQPCRHCTQAVDEWTHGDGLLKRACMGAVRAWWGELGDRERGWCKRREQFQHICDASSSPICGPLY